MPSKAKPAPKADPPKTVFEKMSQIARDNKGDVDVASFAADAKSKRGATIAVPPAHKPSTPAEDRQTPTHVPLDRLEVSLQNVRRTDAEAEVESLADSIAAKGLLQNLVVSPGRAGRFLVDAGGRRLRALQLLAARGVLAPDWPVPVVVIPADRAREASLAENLQKIAMNPADEVEAFRLVVRDYADQWIGAESASGDDDRIAYCARRFGVSERHVRQRLRLAELAPEILDALRDGRVGLDAARAYASVGDHKLQLKIFADQDKRLGRHNAADIRAAFAGKAYPADDRAVRYIGLDAYLSAGGRVETDLFFGAEDRQLLIDTALVDRLAKGKAEKEAQALAQAAGYRDALVKSIRGPSWHEPTPPEGFTMKWGEADRLAAKPAEERAEALASFELMVGENGAPTLVQTRHAYVPAPPKAEEQRPAYDHEAAWKAREEADRRERIRTRAARLAVKALDNEALAASSFFPVADDEYVEPYLEDEGGETAVVAVLVRLPVADVEARLAEAEARIAAEEAELAEEEAAVAAEQQAPQPQPVPA